MKSFAAVKWLGNFKQGQGQITSNSGALHNVNYTMAKRFEGQPGTNPEELLAASHASCFAMALAAEFSKQNIKAIEVTSTVELGKDGEEWRISSSHLDAEADIEGVDEEEFEKRAEVVKSKCPISKALSITITLDARLKGQGSARESTNSARMT